MEERVDFAESAGGAAQPEARETDQSVEEAAQPEARRADQRTRRPEGGLRVKVAKTAGFCFGVERAVWQCREQAERGRQPIYTFGPIIHNEQVVEDLERRGVRVLADERQLAGVREGTVIIRSHGVPRRICEQIRAQGLALVDATCPFVKKIHRIVQQRSESGEYDIVIIGSGRHPEVQGIMGWASVPVTAIENEEEAQAFARAADEDRIRKKKLCIVSQTTFHHNKFNNLVEILGKLRYSDIDVLNTICNATEERQTEARELAAAADAMIVIGGRSSSNTRKLFEICKKECKNTFYIQKLVDLDIRRLPSSGCLGITAGASTPNNLIEEVSKRCQK